jgi:hypothetical protein
MSFVLQVKDAPTAFKTGDVVAIRPNEWEASAMSDKEKWLSMGNTSESWPRTFFKVHVTNANMDGTEAEVQGLLAPFDIPSTSTDFNPLFERRYYIDTSSLVFDSNFSIEVNWVDLSAAIREHLA